MTGCRDPLCAPFDPSLPAPSFRHLARILSSSCPPSGRRPRRGGGESPPLSLSLSLARAAALSPRVESRVYPSIRRHTARALFDSADSASRYFPSVTLHSLARSRPRLAGSAAVPGEGRSAIPASRSPAPPRLNPLASPVTGPGFFPWGRRRLPACLPGSPSPSRKNAHHARPCILEKNMAPLRPQTARSRPGTTLPTPPLDRSGSGGGNPPGLLGGGGLTARSAGAPQNTPRGEEGPPPLAAAPAVAIVS